MSSIREKITIVHKDKVHTFDQYVEGESHGEFVARAKHAVSMTDGDEYYEFSQRGHHYRGAVSETALGHKRRFVQYGPDEFLPGLYLRRGKKVYDYREVDC